MLVYTLPTLMYLDSTYSTLTGQNGTWFKLGSLFKGKIDLLKPSIRNGLILSNQRWDPRLHGKRTPWKNYIWHIFRNYDYAWAGYGFQVQPKHQNQSSWITFKTFSHSIPHRPWPRHPSDFISSNFSIDPPSWITHCNSHWQHKQSRIFHLKHRSPAAHFA